MYCKNLCSALMKLTQHFNARYHTSMPAINQFARYEAIRIPPCASSASAVAKCVRSELRLDRLHLRFLKLYSNFYSDFWLMFGEL